MNNEWNIHFFSEYKVCHKSAEFEAVFTKIEMNKEWNINFIRIQGVSKSTKNLDTFLTHLVYIYVNICVYIHTWNVIKVSSLKLYLPR